MVDILLELLAFAGPTIAAVLTVPILNGIKRLVSLIDDAPAVVKQLLAVVIAFGLTKLGGAINVALPTELSLFTGEDVEGLVSAGIAMAIHAGQKKRDPSAPSLAAVALLVFLPTAAACQTGSATVRVIDRSLLTVEVEPPSYTGEPGDTVTFIATAIDTVSGDTIPAQIQWSSNDTTGVSIDPTTGRATLLRAGTFTVTADVAEIVSIVFLTQDDDGSWMEVYSEQRHALYASRGSFPPGWVMEVGQERPVCTYLESTAGFELIPAELSSSDSSIVSVTGHGGGDTCPSWNGATATMSVGELLQLLQPRAAQVG